MWVIVAFITASGLAKEAQINYFTSVHSDSSEVIPVLSISLIPCTSTFFPWEDTVSFLCAPVKCLFGYGSNKEHNFFPGLGRDYH